MSYSKDQMVNKDYKWNAETDHDNPQIIRGGDASELNRSEGYEMLYFIKSLAKTWGWSGVSLNTWQNLERIIKESVPSNIRTHAKIKEWIAQNYKNI